MTLDIVDCLPSHVNSSHLEAFLYVFEDNEAVIKMMTKGISLQRDMFPELTELRLIGRSIEITWTQKSDQVRRCWGPTRIVTKGNFTRDEWNHC